MAHISVEQWMHANRFSCWKDPLYLSVSIEKLLKLFASVTQANKEINNINLPHVQRKMANEIGRESFCKLLLTTQTGHLASLFLRFSLLLLILLNLQTFGEELDFCFDGSHEGTF